MAPELAYVIITPYSLHKSRTGGILARLITRTGLELAGARVRWFLSVDAGDLPKQRAEAGRGAYRSLTMDGQEIDFSVGFDNLHTRVYEETLAGRGFGIADARPSVELVHAIRHSAADAKPTRDRHPLLKQ